MIKLDRISLINEAGIYSGDLLSISLKALEKKKGGRAYKILEFISLFGSTGVSYTDIIKFIIEKMKGRRYDYTIDRGYYSANLNGSSRESGLLYYYCDKLKGGKYALKPEVLEFIYRELIPSEILNSSKEILDRHITAMRRLSTSSQI